MIEHWEIIKDYPRYEVSNLGRIRVDGYDIKEWPTTVNKYIHIRISNSTGSKTRSVHSLVMEAFIYKFDPTNEINHRDCNKSNNNLENLEYVTHKKNMDHATANGLLDHRYRRGKDPHNFGIPISEEAKAKMKASHNADGNHPNYVLTDDQVYIIKKRRFEGEPLITLANEFEQTKTNISLICTGQRRANIAPEYTVKPKKAIKGRPAKRSKPKINTINITQTISFK
jgi:hypothetical protein